MDIGHAFSAPVHGNESPDIIPAQITPFSSNSCKPTVGCKAVTACSLDQDQPAVAGSISQLRRKVDYSLSSQPGAVCGQMGCIFSVVT